MSDGADAAGRRYEAGADAVAPGPSSWNLPNTLTVVRLLMVPVFVVIAWIGFDRGSNAWQTWAAIVFGAAAITDLVDGELARRTNQVTSFGKIVDPIADKALTGSALVILSWFDLLPWWVTIVIVTREVVVTLLRLSVIRHGVMAASRGGKLKTALQIVAITLYLLPLASGADDVAVWIMGAALVVTVVTGFDYCLRAIALRRAAERTRGASE